MNKQERPADWAGLFGWRYFKDNSISEYRVLIRLVF